MVQSCAQTQFLAPGGRMLSPTSCCPSSTSHQHLPNLGGRGLSPGYTASQVSSFSSSSFSKSSSLRASASHYHDHLHQRILGVASLKEPSGKGFDKKVVEKKTKKRTPSESSEAIISSSRSPPPLLDVPSESSRGRRDEIDEDEAIPEVVTNRMLKRIAITVGIPLAVGLLLFPLFYYLKAVRKLDVPEWLPIVVSMFTFGTAGFGISYGVVSSSWDPAREGSLLGWKEAQLNWPLIWDKFQGNDKKK